MPGLLERYRDVERWSPVMVRMAVASVVLLVVALAGMLVDQRVIAGAPAWLKPAKFGVSTAIFLFSLAFMVRDLERTRTLRIATTAVAWIIVGETVLVCVQSARGTTSHFNINTPLDSAIFSAMGLGIATVWVMSALILRQHWRTPSGDQAMALALRLGLALNIIGAGVGWKMTQPRPDQLAAMQRGERPYIAGTHTMGAPDGGPGLPITRWSTDHGDLRVPHFIGMHALQLLPMLLLGVRWSRSRRDDGAERLAVLFGTFACGAVFGFTLIQALAGHPFIRLPGG